MIEIQKINRIYKVGTTDVVALKNFSLKVEQGEFISIVGPSGSGKTTLLNLIGCLDSFDSGEIIISDQKLSVMDKKEKTEFRKHNIGFIFQTYNLIPVLSAYENVSFALSILDLDNAQIKTETLAILEEVGLKDQINRLPTQLSGGQQQRIAIARALIKKPKIVLADEPTANLDSKTAQEILELMLLMNKKYNTTFIFSTHDEMVMQYARRLVILHDGQLIKDEKR